MREYRGFQPWHLGGDRVYTYAEFQLLVEDKQQADRERAKATHKAQAAQKKARPKRPRIRRGRRR